MVVYGNKLINELTYHISTISLSPAKQALCRIKFLRVKNVVVDNIIIQVLNVFIFLPVQNGFTHTNDMWTGLSGHEDMLLSVC